MNEKLLLGYFLLAFSLTITPGPDWAYVMAAGIRRKITPALTGMFMGYLLVIFFVMAGVGAVVAQSPILLNLLTFLGAAYLFYLGFNILKKPSSIGKESSCQESAKKWIFKGVAVSGLNPKVWLLFVAMLPPFITPNSSLSLPLQIFFLGLIQIANCLLIYPFVGLGVGAALRYKPELSKFISRFSGSLMIIIALSLILEKI